MVQALRQLRQSGLVRRDRSLATMWQIIGWWEARRVVFNVIVGVTGIVTCLIILAIALLGDYVFGIPFGLPDPPILMFLGIILYGTMANVAYTGGWVVELLMRKVWPQESEPFATLVFSLGLVFAVLLTLFPAVLFVPLAGIAFAAKLAGFGFSSISH